MAIASRAEALRVVRAILLTYADHPRPVGQDGDPVLIDNYGLRPGYFAWGITWSAGPPGWAQKFRKQQTKVLAETDGRSKAYLQIATDDYCTTLAATPDVLAVL